MSEQKVIKALLTESQHGGERINRLGQGETSCALPFLGLGRAYALTGDTILWKDADPDIPILKQAKAKYAKLQ